MKKEKCPHCNKQNFNVLSAHLKHCNEWVKIRDEKLNEQYLRKTYIENQMSLPDISKELDGISYRSIQNALRKYNIPIRGIKESIEKSREKSNITNIKKYGVPHNFCKNHPSRIKWQKRLLEEEGITNVFQREDVKEKSKISFFKKYGVENPGQLTMSRGKNTYSSIHKKVVTFLQKNNIQIGIEYKIPTEGFLNQWYISFDIVIKDTNKLIEVNGDYWHANPKIYKETDILLKGSSREMTAKQKWEKDKEKLEFAKKKGYNIFIVWEYELNNSPNIYERILEYAKN